MLYCVPYNQLFRLFIPFRTIWPLSQLLPILHNPPCPWFVNLLASLAVTTRIIQIEIWRNWLGIGKVLWLCSDLDLAHVMCAWANFSKLDHADPRRSRFLLGRLCRAWFWIDGPPELAHRLPHCSMGLDVSCQILVYINSALAENYLHFFHTWKVKPSKMLGLH